jgi:glycosyltransferase involved in cell wall biosynthesis
MNLVSIIIPVKNGEKHLEKCISSLKNLTYPELEIIFINDGSTDNTGEILKKSNVKVVETEGIGPSRARNLALNEAKGEFVAFTDSDCLVKGNWIDELLRGFTNEKIVGVGGDQLSPSDETDFGRNVQDFMKCIGMITGYIKAEKKLKKLKEVKHNPTCNVMYRKSILLELGGFCPGLWPGEDVELDWRITKKGYKLLFNPEAIVYHYRPESPKKYCKMMYSYGKVQAFLVKAYGLFRKIHCVPIFTAMLMICVVALLMEKSFSGLFIVLSVVFLVFLCFLIRSGSLKKSLIFSKLAFITLVCWNLGFLVGLFENSPLESNL